MASVGSKLDEKFTFDSRKSDKSDFSIIVQIFYLLSQFQI